MKNKDTVEDPCRRRLKALKIQLDEMVKGIKDPT